MINTRGRQLRKYRKAQRVTLDALSEELRTGLATGITCLSRSALHRRETGAVALTQHEQVQLVAAIGRVAERQRQEGHDVLSTLQS